MLIANYAFAVVFFFECEISLSQREKCPNTEFFLVCIQPDYGKIRTRKNYVFGHFSRSVRLSHDYLMTLNKMIKAETYFEPSRTSTMEVFAKKAQS